MFNIMFAIPRSAGWVANWREMMGDKVIKIYRPRQIYVGQAQRSFVHMKDRAPAAAFTLTSSKN
jgi:citrate synthase